MNRPLPLPEPGFDVYAPIEPPAAGRANRLALVGAALLLAIFVGIAVLAFRSLDRPSVDTSPALRPTLGQHLYVPPMGPRERVLSAKLEQPEDRP